MAGSMGTWLSRHRWSLGVSLVAVSLLATGVVLLSAVQRARNEAIRSADL